jgi:hypothetical protein
MNEGMDARLCRRPDRAWVEQSESPFVLADCLAEAGFPVENVSSEEFDNSLRADQEAAFALASYICAAQFPALIPSPRD